MTRWNFRTSASCPRCGQVLENKAHITQCPDVDASMIWQHSMKDLGKWLRDNNMAHELSAAIIWGLQQWREPNQTDAPPVGQFVQDQTTIGWEQFLDGWLAKSWRLHQEECWQIVRSQHSSKR